MKLKDALVQACQKYKYPFDIVGGIPKIRRGGSKGKSRNLNVLSATLDVVE